VEGLALVYGVLRGVLDAVPLAMDGQYDVDGRIAVCVIRISKQEDFRRLFTFMPLSQGDVR